MNGKEISLAGWEDRPQLFQLWRTCFHEDRRPAGYFFNNGFRPENCLVVRINGRIAAALHMIPARLVQNVGTVPAHYIYGAGTLPEFRSRGLMADLLSMAVQVGQSRGQMYSFLLPAGETLYHYYEKFGYRSLYKIRVLDISPERVFCDCRHEVRTKFIPDISRIKQIRNEMLETQPGSAQWSENVLSYTAGINRIYGGKLLCMEAEGQYGYAVCRPMEDGRCEVTELVCAPGILPQLWLRILTEMPSSSYRVRLPVHSLLFPGEGTIEKFGMIRPISEINEEIMLRNTRDPYLGMMPD